mgnify:CR=1 FL=1
MLHQLTRRQCAHVKPEETRRLLIPLLTHACSQHGGLTKVDAALVRGENGSLEHKTTGDEILDLFAKLVRGMPADALKICVEKVKASAAWSG